MRRLALGLTLLVVIAAGAFWAVTAPATISEGALVPHTPDLANGKTMFYAGGCAGCHATKRDDSTRLGGGLEMETEFGSFFPPNISPDAKDGIGTWSEADFVTALWKGTSPDGRHYFPAFPYPSYQHMKLEDVRDLFSFLKTLPPVQGRAPAHTVRFPYNVRRGLGLWKMLYLDGNPFTPDAAQSAQWNRGAYLVNGPAHCAECHSPRNLIGGLVAQQRFAGGPTADGEGWVPNITQAGIESYSVGDIEEILTSGITPEGDDVGGDMARVVRNTSQLAKEDRAAMAAYVKSLPPVEGPKPPEANKPPETK
jgi:mono/diheme cytochrome c family protein